MSAAFGFMFGFYALLLGLAVVEIVTGFSNAYDTRHKRPLGVVAPLFGVLLLVDLTTFWTNAWAYRDLPEVTFLIALAVAVVALLYYFAATQVFPKQTEKEKLDDHIMEHRRVVVFCVLAANLATQIPPAISAITTPWPASDIAMWAGLNLFYYALLVAAALVRDKRTVAAIVGFTIVFVVGITLLFA